MSSSAIATLEKGDEQTTGNRLASEARYSRSRRVTCCYCFLTASWVLIAITGRTTRVLHLQVSKSALRWCVRTVRLHVPAAAHDPLNAHLAAIALDSSVRPTLPDIPILPTRSSAILMWSCNVGKVCSAYFFTALSWPCSISFSKAEIVSLWSWSSSRSYASLSLVPDSFCHLSSSVLSPALNAARQSHSFGAG